MSILSGDMGVYKDHLLRVFGFNLDLCPVLDISFNDNADNSLRGRCYGKTVEQVGWITGVFNEAMRREGIAELRVTFPRLHTAPKSDAAFSNCCNRSHTREELESKRGFAMFRNSSRDRVDSMMICHGWYPLARSPRKRRPSLSHRVITDFLRNEFRFDGLVMTDDLDMGAILNTLSSRANGFSVLAIDAGNDLVMICHPSPEIENVRKILETLPREQTDGGSVAKFDGIRVSPHQIPKPAFSQDRQRDLVMRQSPLSAKNAPKQRSVEDGKRSPVEIYLIREAS